MTVTPSKYHLRLPNHVPEQGPPSPSPRQMPFPEAPENRPDPEAWMGPKETVADTAPLGATLPKTPLCSRAPSIIRPLKLYDGLQGPLFVIKTKSHAPSNWLAARVSNVHAAMAAAHAKTRARLLGNLNPALLLRNRNEVELDD
jgi:hypothetical protein